VNRSARPITGSSPLAPAHRPRRDGRRRPDHRAEL